MRESMTKAELESDKIFRGIVKPCGYKRSEMVYGKLITEEGEIAIIPKTENGTYNISWDIGCIDLINTIYYILPETLSEWTGYTDRNGVKIFEGDIVEIEGYWGTYTVPVIRSTDWNFAEWEAWINRPTHVAVIGNIYEPQTETNAD